jgi:hypothetical protein
MKKNHLFSALKIIELRGQILNFNIQNFSTINFDQAAKIRSFDLELSMLLKGITKYDFISKISSTRSLLVGEGNLSFAISLIKKMQNLPELVASVYENCRDWSELTNINAKLLRQSGIKVMHSVDATKLDQLFQPNSFDNLIFQFPHSGSRDGVNGVNPNYILVQEFIKSASKILRNNGVIVITTVDTDFYNNMFRFNDIADSLKILAPVKYRFDPNDYSQYQHSMTNNDDSAIDEYSKFATWEFKI